MTNNPELIPLATALGPIRELYADLIEEALRWQSERARPADREQLALICVGADSGFDPDTTPTRWTRAGSYQVLRSGIPNWCSVNRCLWPLGIPEAMWDWFDFLDETGRLHPASDPLGEIRKPLLCYGRLDQRGQPLPAGAPSTIACECFLPYRETVEILDELQMQAERTGSDPMDALRRLVGRPATGRLGDDVGWDDEPPWG